MLPPFDPGPFRPELHNPYVRNKMIGEKKKARMQNLLGTGRSRLKK
jgi:hypothetical protein